MAEAQSTGRTPALQEVPLEAIKDLIEKGINEVSVKISRRNHRGQLQALVSQWILPPADLQNLDGRLGQMCGGGEYLVDSFNTVNLLEKVLPPFMIRIEGAPRPADTTMLSGQMQQAAGMPVFGGSQMQHNPFDPRHGQAPMVPGLLTPQGASGPLPLASVPGMPFAYAPAQQNFQSPFGWAGGLAPQQQAEYLAHYAQQAQLPPGATVASDAMALKQVSDMKAEVATARAAAEAAEEKLEAERKAHALATSALNERLDKIERDGRERAHQLTIELMEKKFTSQIAQMQTEQKAAAAAAALAAQVPKSDPIASYIPLLTAFVPVFVAMVSGGKDQQAQMMSSMVQLATPKQNNANLDLVKTLAPLLTPMLLKFMDSRGPDAQSRAYEVLADSNMQQMGMMAQFIQTMAASQGNESPWVPFLQQAAGGIMETIGAYMESKKQQQAQGPTLIHQGHVVQGLGAGPQPVPQQPMGTTVVPPQPQPAQPETPEQIVNMIMLSPQVPREFKTQGWHDVLLAIHRQAPVEQAAETFLHHVESLMQTNTLPQVLSQILSQPEQIIGGLLRGLPIAAINAGYTEALITEILRAINEPGEEEEPVKVNMQATQNGDVHDQAPVQPFNAGPIITPAPQQVTS
jgi:hypothetical protein